MQLCRTRVWESVVSCQSSVLPYAVAGLVNQQRDVHDPVYTGSWVARGDMSASMAGTQMRDAIPYLHIMAVTVVQLLQRIRGQQRHPVQQ